MATKEERRIFIGGLVKGVTEEELMEKFSRFGQVGQLEIKTRTSDLDTKTFAYLNLTAEENDFKKCFTAYNNTKWKGGQLKLQFAKESFISKLKREQEEAKQEAERGDCKPAAASTSPALEAHNKKAVPGTPMDEKGNWVMGKYSRVLPVLHVKKPSSRKIITYDPSKMTHSLKRLKCDDASSAENGGNLTWQLEENESEITKRRQGQFPSWQAPRKESIFSRLHGLAMEENISDTEMEVVPVGKMTSHSKMPFASGCGYESSDSAGSADTDEILSKASRKTSSERTPSSITKSPHEKLSERTPSSITKSPHEKVSERTPSSTTKSPHEKVSERTPSSIIKSPHKKLSERTPCSITKSPHEKLPERTPSRAKNCQSKASPVKTSSGKDYESDGSNSGDDADLEETPTLTKVPSKKKATDSTSLSGPSVRKKAPVDSSDSDSDSEAAEAGQGPQFKFVKSKTVQGRCLKKSAKMSQPKTPPFRGLGMLSSDEDNNGEEERMKVSTPSSEKKAPKTNSLAKKQAPKSLENMPLRGRGDGLLLISSPERRSEKLQNASSKLNRKTSQDLKSVGSPNSSTSQLFQQKRVSEDCEDTDDALTAMRTPKRKEQELSKMIIEEFASGIEEGSPLASSSHKSQRSGLEGSDDSDLDDNDFELVGKKLEARAKQQQDKRTKRDKSQRGTNLDSTSSTAPGIHGTKKMKESVGDVRLEGELTSMQKSHQARKRNQEEVKKKENIITKSIREGTDSKHITFSDTEEDKSVRSEQKPALFEDSDFDEENNDFYIRPQFHGKKGRKLMELQSKDIRFRIDQRFAESDSEEEEEERTTDKDSGDELMAQEKARNMQILEKVLGFKPRERKRNLYQDMNQRRYIDPITSKHLEQTASVTEGETHTRKKKHDQVQNDNDNNAGGDDAEEEEEEEEGTSEEEEDGEEDAGDDDSDEEEEEEEDTEEEEEESEKEEESKDGIGGAHSQGEEDSKAEEKDSGKNDRDENDEQDSEDDDDGGNQDAAEEDSDDDTGGSAEEEEDSDDDTGASAEEEEDSAKEEQSGAGEGDDSAMVTDSKANTSSKLADLFAGGSSFAFFGTPAADAEPSITLSQLEDKDDDEDEEMEDLEEAEPAPSPPRVAETDILQPSFILNGLDHRLKAAVRFFKRPAEEEFQEMVEGWPDKRQKIMQLVRDRHKRALRKERKAQRQEQWQKKQIRRKRFKK